MIFILNDVVKTEQTVTSQPVLCNCNDATLLRLLDSVEANVGISREYFNAIPTFDYVAALYFRSVSLMNTYANAEDVVYFQSEDNLLCSIALQIYTHEHTVAD
jgi:hypothetical protein